MTTTETVSDDFLAREYRDMHVRRVFGGLTVLKYQDSLAAVFKNHGVHTFLDYGCGPGVAWVDSTPNGATAFLYDPYVEEFSALPNGPFDAVIAIDVLEHVPLDGLSVLFCDVFHRAAKVAVFSFCARPAKKVFSDGSNVHITQQPGWWWADMIRQYNHGLPFVLWETP